MIEYQLNTGFGSTGENFHQFGQVFNGIGSVFNNNALDNDISVNGQTLLETVPQIQVTGQQEIILNSGDFFLSGSFLRNGTGFLDLNYGISNLKYDSNVSGQRYFFKSSSHSVLVTGFSGNAGNLGGSPVFLNGIKLASGESYIENGNGNFSWVDSDTSVTGVLFSRPLKNWPVYTGRYDLVGLYFNEGESVGYLNGVKLDNASLIELSSLLTGVIKTGIEPSVEFSMPQESQTIFL